MSELRKSVLKRVHRKSTGSNQDFQEETSINAENLQTTVASTPDSTSVSNSSRTKKKRLNKKKGKNLKRNTEMENRQPMAQSTMIEESSPNIVNSVLKENNLRILGENKTINNNKENNPRILGENKTINNNKEPFDKISSQETTDLILEYHYKYGRLSNILEQFKNEQAELLAGHERQRETAKDSKSKLNNQLYTIELEKFNFEEDLQKLKKENEELRSKLSKYEKETKSSETQTEQKKEVSSNTDTNSTQAFLPPLDLSRSSYSGKQKLSRTHRKSILSDTINAMTNDRDKKIELYTNIILDQENIMDFYSLLAGTSVWKPRAKEQDGGHEENANNEEEIEEPVEMKFGCKIQLQNDLEGYEFEMALNRTTRQVLYIPYDSFKDGPYFDKLPNSLKNNVSYAADDACLFVGELSKTISPS